MFSKKDHKNIHSIKKSSTGSKVRDYGNDSYFTKKAKAAKEVIEKYGLPKQMQTGKK